MTDEPAADLSQRYHVYERRTVIVDDFAASGPILDIGGGGEGIIGALKGEQVVAIDLRRSELEEAPDGPLKLVADARNLPFLGGTFAAATAFFSLMYVRSRPDHAAVFAEAYRVLRPGGGFFVWDATVSRPAQSDKPAYVLLLRVLVGDRSIDTGYGQPWPDEPRGPEYYRSLATQAGFRLVEEHEESGLFFLELRKPT